MVLTKEYITEQNLEINLYICTLEFGVHYRWHSDPWRKDKSFNKSHGDNWIWGKKKKKQVRTIPSYYIRK